MKRLPRLGTIGICAAALAAGACNHERLNSTEPSSPATTDNSNTDKSNTDASNTSANEPVDAPATATSAASMEIDFGVDATLAELCGIPKGTVFFSFDSATLNDGAKTRLQNVSDCVNDKKFNGRDFLLVGAADPRGTDSYNDDLGMSRATSVRNYLVQCGVPSDRLTVRTEGEVEAITNEENYDKARRVILRMNDDA